MKVIYFTILISLIGFKSRLLSQNHSSEILTIDQKVNLIQNTIDSYQKIEKYKDSSGYRCVFLKNKKIEKIEVCSIQKNIKKKVEWFYQNNILIFSDKNWTKISDNKLIDREKIYTDQNNVLVWFDKQNKIIDTSTDQYRTICDEVVAYGKSLLLKNQD